MDVLDQYRAAGQTAQYIVPIIKAGYRVLVTHGNGPQVGFILLRSELARDTIHQVPLANCVADTQGSIGLQIAQSLQNEFLHQGVEQAVAALVTQCVVDEQDPSFSKPSKPIGPFMSEAGSSTARAGRRLGRRGRLRPRLATPRTLARNPSKSSRWPQFVPCSTAARWSSRLAVAVYRSCSARTASCGPAPP